MLFSEALELFDLAMVGEKSQSTRRTYQERLRSLARFFEGRPVETISIHDLRRWRASLVARAVRYENHPKRPREDGGLSSYTIRGRILATKAFFAWLAAEGLIPSDPAVRLNIPDRPERSPKAIDLNDMLAIVRTAREKSARDYALVRFLADTGCRASEVARLQVSNLRLAEGEATVVGKGRGGGRERTVWFGPETAKALENWLRVRPGTDHDYVFVDRRGAPLSYYGVYYVIERLAAAAGVSGRHNPHSFRHGLAHAMLKNNADLKTVAESLGHTDVTTTSRIYLNLTKREMGERHRRFSWLRDE